MGQSGLSICLTHCVNIGKRCKKEGEPFFQKRGLILS